MTRMRNRAAVNHAATPMNSIEYNKLNLIIDKRGSGIGNVANNNIIITLRRVSTGNADPGSLTLQALY